jgi:hypothetical protein
MASIAVLAACSARTTRAGAADLPRIERAVDAVTDSVAAAVDRKDVARLGALLSGAQYIGSGLVIPPGRFVAMAGPAFGQLAVIRLVWDSRQVRVLAPGVLLMTARATTVSRDTAGTSAREQGVYTMVFVRDSAGAWSLASVHKTSA